jgi:hypothetical protein
VLTNCIAVRAVVASSNKRSFVMMVWVPGKNPGKEVLGKKILAASLGSKSWQQVLARAWQQILLSSSAINGQALGRIVAGSQGGFVFILERIKP